MNSDDKFLEMNEEDVKKLGKQLAEVLCSDDSDIFPVVVDLSEILDLEATVSSVGGIADPLGQLKAWIEDLIKSVGGWIVDTLKGAVWGYVDWLWDSITGRFTGLWSSISTAFSSLWTDVSDAFTSLWSKASTAFSTLWANITTALGDLWADITASFSSLWTNITTVFGDLWTNITTAFSSLWTNISSAFGDLWTNISTTFGGLWANITTAFGDLWANISSAFGDLWTDISTAFGTLWTNITTAFGNLWANITTAFGDLWTNITTAFSSLWTDISTAFSTLWTDISTTFGDLWTNISTALGNLWTDISTTFGVLWANITTAFGDLWANITTAFGDLWANITTAFEDLWANITTAFGDLIEFLSGLLSSIMSGLESLWVRTAEGFANLWVNIAEGFSNLLSFIGESLSNLFEGITSAIGDFVDFVSRGIESFIEMLGTLWENVATFFGTLWENIATALSGLWESFVSLLSDLWTNIAKTISELWVNIAEGFSNLLSFIGESLGRLWEGVSQGLVGVTEFINEYVVKPLLEGLGTIVEMISKGFALIGKTFEGFINAILRLPETLWNMLPDWLKEAIKAIQDFFTAIHDGFVKFIADPLGTLKSSIDWLAEQIWNMLPDWLKGAIKAIQDFFEWLYDQLLKFVSDPIGYIRTGVIEPLYDALCRLGEWLWNMLPDWFKNAIKQIHDFFVAVWEGIIAFFKDPIGALKDAFEWLAEQIWKMLPDWAKEFIQRLRDFFVRVWEGLVFICTKAWEWLMEFLEDPVGALKKAFEYIVEALRRIAGTVASYVKGAVTWVLEALTDFIYGLVSTVAGIIRRITTAIMDMLTNALKSAMGLVETAFEEGAKLIKDMRGSGISEITAYTIFILPYGAFDMMTTLVPTAMEGVGETFHFDIELGGEGSGMPIRVGLAGRIASLVRAKLGAIISTLGKTFKHGLTRVTDSMVFVTALWSFEWMRFVFRPAWMSFFKKIQWDTIGYEIPTMTESIRIMQRYYPTGYTSAMFDRVGETLWNMGYPLWVYDYVIDPAKEIHSELAGEIAEGVGETFIVTVRDRFGVERKFPCSGFYDIPTPSELCRMMIKDIIIELPEFTKAMLMHGFPPDVSYMHYLLHFRYPSPDKLWEFTTRGIAGLIWFVPTDEMRSEAKREAEVLKATVPIDPVELNFDYDGLLGSFGTYMKWHDYARHSWIHGYTSDNWLMLDVLADVPMKIDIRWMTKWGIFDFMSERGIVLDSPVGDFIKVVDDVAENEKVMMDLTLKCRMLQGTGILPYYIPVVAVAESINALADERVLLRTGLINLYEVGASTYEELDDLMSRLVTASFRVAYFDIKERIWREGYVNLPVMFLPGERKLLELRGLIDRYHRIYKDILKDTETAYKEHIFEVEDVKDTLSKTIGIINELFTKTAEEITGRRLELVLDEDFITGAMESMKLERLIWTTRRVRYWYARILAWLFYRLAYAYVTIEDVNEVLEVAKEMAKLTDEEITAMRRLMEVIIGIAGREYIPTPSMLATIVEIVPGARAKFDEVVEARRIPAGWVPIWRHYVNVKPIVDEVKKVLSRAEKLFADFMITKEQFGKFLEILMPYGYETTEIKLIMDRVSLERWHQAFDQLVGTPKELVTFAEYSPTARMLALGQVYKMIEALPVSEEVKEFLKAMWEEYIRVRPVHDEMKRYVSELVMDYAKGVITMEQLIGELEGLKKWGLDDFEIAFYVMLAEKRRWRYELAGTSS